MTTDREKACRQLDRLAEALARDLDGLSDEEVLAEAAETYGDVETAATETRSLMEAAISASGKRRLAAARKAYKAHIGRSRAKVLQLSFERKRALVEQFASHDNELREKLTLAARKGEDSEADIDSFVEDLLELGVIDEEGNAR